MIPVLQPKQVQCIRPQAGSFLYECIYDVSDGGCVIFSSGNLSTIKWDDINFFKPIYTDKELLEYAKKMYPIGTKHKCAFKTQEDEILESTKDPGITPNGNIDAGPGYIYYKKTNTWAEIISEQTEVKLETPLEKCNKLFTIGKTVLSTFDTQFIVKTDHLPFSAYPGGDIFTKKGNYCLYEAEKGKYATIVEVESFAVKCPENYASNEVWKKYISWLNKKFNANAEGGAVGYYYGINKSGAFVTTDRPDRFNEVKKLKHLYDLLCIMKPEITSQTELKVKYAKELAEVERLFPEGTNGRTKSWTNPPGYISVKRNGKLLFDEYDNHVRITSEQRTGILWSTKYGYSIPDNKNQLKVGDWIKLIDKPIDGSRPRNWTSNMYILYSTWQKVIKFGHNNKPCVSAPNAAGDWVIEHCNYTDVKTHEEYMRDVAYVYETVLPPDFTKNLCSEVTMPRTDIENVKVTDEEYKKAKPYNNTDELKHTFQPFEDAHNKAYDLLISEGQVLIDGGLIKPEWVSRPLNECYPATPDGWMPTGLFTKSTANLVATKPVKITGYKYVTLKNK